MSYNYYVYTPERSESDFLRNSLLKMAAEKTTPKDVFEADFSNVTTEQMQYLSICGEVTVDYNVSIGYYRWEEYEEYNNGTKRYETKRKEVTDWHPDSGSYTSTSLTAYVECGNSSNDMVGKFVADAVRTCNPDNIAFYDEDDKDDIVGLKELEEADAENAKELLHSRGREQCRSHLPGDTYKDFSGTSHISISERAVHIAPLHTLTYTYKDVQYTNKALSFGKYNEISEMPDATAEHAKELNQKILIFGLVALALAVISSIISLTIPNSALIWIGFISSVASTVLFLAIRFIFKKNLNKRDKEIKIKEVSKLLERLGLSNITEEEMKSLN